MRTSLRYPPLESTFQGDPLSSIHVDSVLVQKKLDQLKASKSPGPDKLHPRVFKRDCGFNQ